MKSFGAYISKHFASFTAFILTLIFINAVIFGITFHKTFIVDYGETSPRSMLEITAASASQNGLSEEVRQKLQQNNIWAIYLNPNGKSVWSLDLPQEIPQNYTIQDVALFSKGYIKDYPVFVWGMEDGLLILGYPKDSYTKLTSNYYAIQSVKRLPLFLTGMLSIDLLLLFLAYFFSKRKIIQNTAPIIAAVKTLSEGKTVSLHVSGELSEVANSVNKASKILSRQNEARANWISGVSHDIRTPLSMIMGYAGRIAENQSVNASVKEQAGIIRKQSIKIKELVQDLNLVSQLEYEMQPLHKEPVRLSKLIRSYVADLLNAGISDSYTVDVEIAPDTEFAILECDSRLIFRAVNNLVQNSIKHNPQGCEIKIILERAENSLLLSVTDSGIGLSPEKLQELEEKSHYMESTDERLNLRHGMGLLIVQQVAKAHNGTLDVKNASGNGCKITLSFPSQN